MLPDIEPFNFHAQGVNSGVSTRVMCTVSGDQPLLIQWLKNGEIIPENNKMVQLIDDYTSMLLLRNVSLKDTGNYSCVVSNPAGKSIYSAVLKVKGLFYINFKILL